MKVKVFTCDPQHSSSLKSFEESLTSYLRPIEGQYFTTFFHPTPDCLTCVVRSAEDPQHAPETARQPQVPDRAKRPRR